MCIRDRLEDAIRHGDQLVLFYLKDAASLVRVVGADGKKAYDLPLPSASGACTLACLLYTSPWNEELRKRPSE